MGIISNHKAGINFKDLFAKYKQITKNQLAYKNFDSMRASINRLQTVEFGYVVSEWNYSDNKKASKSKNLKLTEKGKKYLNLFGNETTTRIVFKNKSTEQEVPNLQEHQDFQEFPQKIQEKQELQKKQLCKKDSIPKLKKHVKIKNTKKTPKSTNSKKAIKKLSKIEAYVPITAPITPPVKKVQKIKKAISIPNQSQQLIDEIMDEIMDEIEEIIPANKTRKTKSVLSDGIGSGCKFMQILPFG